MLPLKEKHCWVHPFVFLACVCVAVPSVAFAASLPVHNFEIRCLDSETGYTVRPDRLLVTPREPFQESTPAAVDLAGRAHLNLANGVHELHVTSPGYRAA